MLRLTCLIAIACSLCACAAAPQPSTAQATTTAADTEQVRVVEQGTRDAVVCNYESLTGSHRKTRVCRTISQRTAERESGQAAVRQIQRVGTKPVN